MTMTHALNATDIISAVRALAPEIQSRGDEIAALRRLPIAYGIVSKHRIDDEVLASWVRPARDPGSSRFRTWAFAGQGHVRFRPDLCRWSLLEWGA